MTSLSDAPENACATTLAIRDRLDEDEPRGQGTEDRVQHEQVAHRAGSAHEALVEDTHGQPAVEPPLDRGIASDGRISSPLTRARNT